MYCLAPGLALNQLRSMRRALTLELVAPNQATDPCKANAWPATLNMLGEETNAMLRIHIVNSFLEEP